MSELAYRIAQVLREEAGDLPGDLRLQMTDATAQAVVNARREHFRRALVGDLCGVLYQVPQLASDAGRGPYQHELLADNIADLLTELGWITRTDIPVRDDVVDAEIHDEACDSGGPCEACRQPVAAMRTAP